MQNIDDIISQNSQTLEDIFSGKFCKCKHLLTEHTSWKCWSLSFNGTVWYGCDCTVPIEQSFEIKFYVPIQTDNNTYSKETIS